MRTDITRWVREYQQCAWSKIIRHNVSPLESVHALSRGRFTHAHVYITEPLGLSHGYNYILAIIDCFFCT